MRTFLAISIFIVLQHFGILLEEPVTYVIWVLLAGLSMSICFTQDLAEISRK